MIAVSFCFLEGKKGQISGISSPKLTLCRIGYTANLVSLPEICKQVSSKSPSALILMEYRLDVINIYKFCEIGPSLQSSTKD